MSLKKPKPATRFTYNKATKEWTSACGNYTLWIQGFEKHVGPEWGASFKGQDEWLCRWAGSRAEAAAICREHAAERKGDG